ncbi:MAG: UDP-N-acetyl-2-amino-2-deoxyglucuronate dehydrogenase [Thermoanaerobacteraceae bacterium]|nr:UDP-N-acetyl-2-amino-2-deoxyglucuronate dehydrogenase [Thermoanaerobacteraceae bacterium]
MEKLKIGIIGCGSIISKHLKAVVENSDKMELLVLCDTVPGKMDVAVDEYIKAGGTGGHHIKKYTDYMKLLENPDINLVTVATISGIRPKIALDALDAGKHVILEKPMALSIKEADEIIKKSEEKGLKVAVCHQMRFLPYMMKLKKAITSGAFGKLVHASASMRWNRNDAYYSSSPWRGTWEYDGGAFMNQAIHVIDILLWLMGPVARVYAETGTFLKKIEAEDAGAAVLRFKNGAVGTIEASVCVYPKNLEETLGVFGEKGTVLIGGKALNKVETWNIEGEAPLEAPEIPPNLHTLLYRDMTDAVVNDRQPLINAREGKNAVELILSIYKSSLTKKPVDLPLGDFSTKDMIGGTK